MASFGPTRPAALDFFFMDTRLKSNASALSTIPELAQKVVPAKNVATKAKGLKRKVTFAKDTDFGPRGGIRGTDHKKMRFKRRLQYLDYLSNEPMDIFRNRKKPFVFDRHSD